MEDRFWPRKWLGTKRVDDWHDSSTGFREGEAAFAFGRVNAGGQVQVDELLQSPWREAVARIGYENRVRRGLGYAAKGMLSLFFLGYGLPRRGARAVATPGADKPQ